MVTIVLLAFPMLVTAQQEVTFSGNFEGVSYTEFFDVFEKETGYRVYLNEADFDSLKVNIQLEGLTVQEVLLKLFTDTDFYFAIDPMRNIFIVKGVYLYDKLPHDFFSGTDDKDSQSMEILPFSNEPDIRAIGRVSMKFGLGNAKVEGKVLNSAGSPIGGATVFCEETNGGAVTDESGNYELILPKGVKNLTVRAIGYQTSLRKIALYGDGTFDISLLDDVRMLNEVIVESERGATVKGLQMGVERLDISKMKTFSAVMGEVDILRVVLALPGVQTVGEASTGLNVRGGAAGQNLILYNNAVVYNPTHLFGFFTAFNPDEIKSAELLKSGIPAEKGGRLSAILDITSRPGNNKKFVGTGGIGPLTGRFTFEGPIINDRTSFLVGGRSSYSNWLLKKIPSETLSNSIASFYDVNASVDHSINSNNNLYASAYFSNDKFRLNDDSLYQYNNRALSLRWNHVFFKYLNGGFVLSNSGYNYSVSSSSKPTDAFEQTYSNNQIDLKADFTYTLLEKHTIAFGLNSTFYWIMPGLIKPVGDSSLVAHDRLQRERGIESALFVADNFEFNQNLSLYAGLRYSLFTSLGPMKLYTYPEGSSKNEDNIVDTLYVPPGGNAAFYHGPEFRFSLRYLIRKDFSVKASYNVTRQYLHMLSNSTAVSPTDVWKISGPHIKPQIGTQISVGFYKTLRSGMFELSSETYYKTSRNSLDFKDGGQYLLNHFIETDVLSVRGLAYGSEFLLKKSVGKLNGWLSYTYSRSLLRTNSDFASETVNGGYYYSSNYDKPHAINLTGNYKFSHRFSLSLNATYSTGRPITLPLAKYNLEDATRLLYSERNFYRIPDYFRIDVSINVEGNHRIKKLAHSSWTVGVYNLTGRRNIYSVYFKSDGEAIRGYKMSIFGTPIPSVTYNFRF